MALSSLAELFSAQGDAPQATAQARRALARCNQLPDPAGRALSHNNLAIYLAQSGNANPAALAEAAQHQMAALTYRLVSGHVQDLQTSLHNYGNAFHHAHANHSELPVPRLAFVLTQPGFDPLAQWLALRQVDLAALQAEIDQGLAQTKQQALAENTAPTCQLI